jgi:hypothetical protein
LLDRFEYSPIELIRMLAVQPPVQDSTDISAGQS